MKNFLFYISLLFSTLSFSQYAIKGQIFNASDSLVPFSNVIVLNPVDSSIVKGSISNDGNFTIENLDLDSGLLKITAIGFESLFQVFERPNGKEMDLGRLTLKNSELKGVDIVATRPIFTSKGDRIEVDVENSSLSNQGSAFEVLRSSPKIMIGSNDNITVIGKGTPMIYIDNQPINSIEILKALPSTEIRSIEIIENPSAKYDASGSAVILINTKKQNLNGYQINLLNNTKMGRKVSNYSSISADYKKGKFGIQGFYGFFFGRNWNKNDIGRNVYYPSDTITMDNDVHTVKHYKGNHSYKLSLFYNPDSVSNINIKYNGYYRDVHQSVDNTNILQSNNFGQTLIYSRTEGEFKSFGNTVQLNYSRDLDTSGSVIYTGVQYSQYRGNNQDSISENNDFQFPNRLNLNNSDINFASGKLDYEKKWNKGWALDLGAKYTYVFNKGDSKFSDIDQFGNPIAGTVFDDDFNYNEHILAGYVEGSKTWEKVFLRLGVRTEWARTKGSSKQYNEAIADTGYINFFPSFLMTWDFAKNWKMNLNYNRRINRPSFQDMTPYVDYVDSLSAFVGNPHLRPSYAHEAEMSIVYREFASLELGYTYTQNAITLFVEKDTATNAFRAQERNINNMQSLNVGLNLPYQLKWWTTYNGFGMNYNISEFQLDNGLVSPKKPMFYVYLYNKLAIPKVFDFEITYIYHSSGIQGIFEFIPSHNLMVSFSRKFLNDQLQIRISGSDLLWIQTEGGTSRLEGYDVRFQEFWDSFNCRITISYKFGKLQNKNDDYKSKLEGEEKRIKN
ncbi:MAG: TonB-dependent receptor [Crocinitomicaceae bacterium]|nr:TonB-dependent receptor [Crocinitomicaceae bacterium]